MSALVALPLVCYSTMDIPEHVRRGFAREPEVTNDELSEQIASTRAAVRRLEATAARIERAVQTLAEHAVQNSLERTRASKETNVVSNEPSGVGIVYKRERSPLQAPAVREKADDDDDGGGKRIRGSVASMVAPPPAEPASIRWSASIFAPPAAQPKGPMPPSYPPWA